MSDVKSVALPRLDGLTPTLESTALKLMEETGELGAAIGKVRGMSGESERWAEDDAMRHVAAELLDVAQTAVTMMFVLQDHYDIDVRSLIEEHTEKLMKKGYLTIAPSLDAP